jgi:hypothetical protein
MTRAASIVLFEDHVNPLSKLYSDAEVVMVILPPVPQTGCVVSNSIVKLL